MDMRLCAFCVCMVCLHTTKIHFQYPMIVKMKKPRTLKKRPGNILQANLAALLGSAIDCIQNARDGVSLFGLNQRLCAIDNGL